ncbi:zinc finger FYVE domain-containing protein 26-like [Aplochiton taeniatus]
MKYALYALCVNAHKYSDCSDCEAMQPHQNSGSEKDKDQANLSSHGSHSLFHHFLSECQLYLEAVPALFRLELLENIFSLLFLSTSDFTQQNQKDTTTADAAQPDSENNNNDVKEVEKTHAKMACMVETAKSPDHTDIPSSAHQAHLDLGHFTQGCRGFLVDVTAMEGFLKLLKEGLEGVFVVGQQGGQAEGRPLDGEAEVAESLGCSVTAETFGSRLQRLSKRTAEAQWRLQIIISNMGSGSGVDRSFQNPVISHPAPVKRRSSSSSSSSSGAGQRKRRRRPGRHPPERRASVEKHNGDVSPNTSAGYPLSSPTSNHRLENTYYLLPYRLAMPSAVLLY